MTDERLEEIQVRHQARFGLVGNNLQRQMQADIGALLDLVDALQSRLNSAKGLISTAQEKNHQDMGGWGACPICSASDNPVDADGNPTDAEDADHYYCDHDEDCLVLVLDELEAVLNG